MYYHALAASDGDNRTYTAAARRNAAVPEPRILVAFDGSPAARCALEYAMEQARDSAAAIHVVNVNTAVVEDAVAYRSHKQAREDLLKTATTQLDFHRIRHTTEVAFGAVAESLVQSAAANRCGTIVIGTRDRLAIANFFSASVSAQVVRLSPVPVTVVKQKVIATTHLPRNVWSAAWRARI
jgi:nucleotide-binding universal stress UspA family protein